MTYMENQIQIDLNVTNRCNFNCIHCGFDSGKSNLEDMDLSLAKKILKDFKSLGGIKVDLTGGEPMLHKDIDKIISYANKLNLRTKLVTNGSLLTEEKLWKLKQAGLKGISVSLDGPNYKSFKQTRPETIAVYHRIIKTIKNSVKIGLFTKINTVIFDYNLYDIEYVVKQAIDLGVHEIRFCFFSPVGRGANKTEHVADPKKWLQICRNNLGKYNDKIKITLEAPIIESHIECNVDCLAKNISFLQIFPNGDAFPCSIMATYNKPLGNLKYLPLKTFWPNRRKISNRYFKNHIQELFYKYSGCVNYNFNDLIKSKAYKFVCPCRKFQIKKYK